MKDLPPGTQVVVRVTLLDSKKQHIDIEYDGHPDAPMKNGVWTATRGQQLQGTGQLRQVQFLLPRARLANRQNYGSDFRIRGLKLAVHQVQVAKAVANR